MAFVIERCTSVGCTFLCCISLSGGGECGGLCNAERDIVVHRSKHPKHLHFAELMGRRFTGQSLADGSTESDYFKLLERDGSSLMVGAR